MPARAPRLRPDERIAPHVTRAGRFLRIDPAQPRRLPAVARLVAALAWAVLVEESLRRAWQADRTADGGDEEASAEA